MDDVANVTPHLQDLLGRIDRISDIVANIRSETANINDRMFGPAPEPASDVPKPGEDGDVGRLFSACEHLEALVSSTADQILRLRRL